MQPPTQPVAATIVARNYLAYARTLCRSFLTHHPEGRFFVLLADELGEGFDPDEEPFELIRLDDLDLPRRDYFFYQYSTLELCTAVKPFLLQHLFDTFEPRSLLYLDPDVYVTAPLDSVLGALNRAAIVLTPHMLAPPPDDGETPGEKEIMLSGIYNLGFLGLRDSAPARQLLSWWQERLTDRCVIDPANALFVDQRWMDLAPGYFNDVEILKDPALNVAYWNLHERALDKIHGAYHVNGAPLGFFHFSGFNPRNPSVLSKHQTRHRPGDNPALSSLCRLYARELARHGHKSEAKRPAAFDTLPNGVRLSRLTQFVVRKAQALNLDLPEPVSRPDAFCQFLMTPSHDFDPRGIAPILVALEHHRGDVKAAYPMAFESSGNALDVTDWLRTTGGREEHLSELFARFGHLLGRVDAVRRAVDCWRKRDDLRAAFPRAFASTEGSKAYARWIERHGTTEEGFAPGDGETFLARRKGLLKPLMLYFQDPDLQRSFPFPFLEKDRRRYVGWLYKTACPRKLVASEDAAWFDGFAGNAADRLAALVLGHGAWLNQTLRGGGTVFDTQDLKAWLESEGAGVSARFLAALYTHPLGRDVFTQAEQYHRSSPRLQSKFPSVFEDGKGRVQFIDLLIRRLEAGREQSGGIQSFEALRERNAAGPAKRLCRRIAAALGARHYRSVPHGAPRNVPAEQRRAALLRRFNQLPARPSGVNVAGYFNAPTGMGESARSMARTLEAAGVPASTVPIPLTQLEPALDLDDLHAGRLFGTHDPAKRVNVIVANGDDCLQAQKRLPPSFMKGRRNIGYWVWETENFPESSANTEGLNEIWTPSAYSAAAIRTAVDLPVHVVPHVPDFAALERIEADRARFGLPENTVVFGFFFDLKSAMERKNPMGLLRAFRRAFGADNREAMLVLKASDADTAPAEYARLTSAARDLNVVWIKEPLSRDMTLKLMKSLDVYASLHRSEGFGLTLAESMALKKPVIASDYSGNLEFMTDQNARLVPTETLTTDRPHGAYPKGSRWGDPDVDAAAAHMRDLMDAGARERLGHIAAASVRDTLDPKTIGRRAAELLDGSPREIKLRSRRRPSDPLPAWEPARSLAHSSNE